MTHHHRSPDPSPSPATAAIVPPVLVSLMAAFRSFFTAPVWDHVLVLVTGAILTPGKRTVSAVLRIMGLSEAADFALYHHVLSQAHWDSRVIARRLLSLILERLLPSGPVIIGIDDTIERRWALPFLTILAPSQRSDDTKGRRHKTLTDWARQGILQVRRWMPNRLIVIVADSSFAVIELIAAVRRHVCFVTRLRLDANLFEPAPERRGGRGRPRKKGCKLRKLAEVLTDKATVWTAITMAEWYGGKRCRLEYVTGTAIWYHGGLPPVPIRWVLVRDPTGTRKPQAFLCTDLDATPAAILGWFVHRWSMETTFQETREHLGIETQRQWSDLAIARSTPALFGLFSLVTLWAAEAKGAAALHPRSAAWYVKDEPTFSDAIATVRRVLWTVPDFSISRLNPENVEIPAALLQRLIEAVCYTT